MAKRKNFPTWRKDSRTMYFKSTKAYCWCIIISVVLKFFLKQNKKKKIYKIYSSAFVWNILIPFLERKWKICGKTVIEHIITGSYNKDNITFTTLLFKLFLLNFSLWFAITFRTQFKYYWYHIVTINAQ